MNARGHGRQPKHKKIPQCSSDYLFLFCGFATLVKPRSSTRSQGATRPAATRAPTQRALCCAAAGPGCTRRQQPVRCTSAARQYKR